LICSQSSVLYLVLFFFFQAEDGIRDRNVTGVQTCSLPIYRELARELPSDRRRGYGDRSAARERARDPEHVRYSRPRGGRGWTRATRRSRGPRSDRESRWLCGRDAVGPAAESGRGSDRSLGRGRLRPFWRAAPDDGHTGGGPLALLGQHSIDGSGDPTRAALR